MRSLILTTLITLTAITGAYADVIVIDGKQYEDVLIYESDTFYFVKLPKAGDIISVKKTDVLGKPQINDDYFYRSELRKTYEEVRDGKRPPASNEGSTFQLEEGGIGGSESVDTAALLSGGAGGGKPLNLTLADAKAAFSGLGVSFSGSGDSIEGKSSDGVVSATLKSEDGKVTLMSATISGTDIGVIQQKAMGFGQMMGRVAPWSGPWLMQNMQTLMTGGNLQKTQDGVSITINAGPDGLSFQVAGA